MNNSINPNQMDTKPLRLSIRIPVCNCDSDCICRQYIKCNNNCFCGNKKMLKQVKSKYGALTPDYIIHNRLSFDIRERNISFGNIEIFLIKKLVYMSPRLKASEIKFFSPQYNKKNVDVKTPNSV